MLKEMKMEKQALVGILMGSDSDWPIRFIGLE